MKKELAEFWKEEDAVAVVEIILIVVVLIALVLIFKERLTTVVNSVLDTITSKAGSV